MSAGDPEPQIAARALLGLWHVQAESLRKHLASSPAPPRIRELVSADVRRAARLIETGLRSFPPALPAGRRGPVSLVSTEYRTMRACRTV